MANKLAGQRAKYTKFLAKFKSTDDDDKRSKAAQKMAEVIAEAAPNGFTPDQVTQGAEIPEQVRHLAESGLHFPEATQDDPDQSVRQVHQMVDTTDLQEVGNGTQSVCAYGYRCAPDRLKIGRSEVDVINRIVSQISTSTPDQPNLVLVIKSDCSRSLEKALHGVLEIRGRKVQGGGEEWYRTTREELMQIYTAVSGSLN